MKNTALMFALLACFAEVHAAKSCDELKTEVSAKLDGKGIKNYTLEIVENDKAGEGKVVGSCELGKKKVIYKKGTK